jgi:hypothetical protein
LKAWPSAEKSPVSDSDAPMTTGFALPLPEELVLPLLLQAATTIAVAAVTAEIVKNRVR